MAGFRKGAGLALVALVLVSLVAADAQQVQEQQSRQLLQEGRLEGHHQHNHHDHHGHHRRLAQVEGGFEVEALANKEGRQQRRGGHRRLAEAQLAAAEPALVVDSLSEEVAQRQNDRDEHQRSGHDGRRGAGAAGRKLVADADDESAAVIESLSEEVAQRQNDRDEHHRSGHDGRRSGGAAARKLAQVVLEDAKEARQDRRSNRAGEHRRGRSAGRKMLL